MSHAKWLRALAALLTEQWAPADKVALDRIVRRLNTIADNLDRLGLA